MIRILFRGIDKDKNDGAFIAFLGISALLIFSILICVVLRFEKLHIKKIDYEHKAVIRKIESENEIVMQQWKNQYETD